MAATLVRDVTALALALSQRQTLDFSLPEDDRLTAVALRVEQAGTALSPRSANPRSVLKAFAVLENLAGFAPGLLTKIWVALRALDLRAGEHVGGALVDNPLALALLRLNGAVPTGDLNEMVGGVLGDAGARTEKSLTARARLALLDATDGAFELRTAEAILLVAAADSSAEDLLESVDALPTRHAAAAAAPAVKTAPPLAYTALAAVDNTGPRDNLFAAYVPARLRFDHAMPHPSPLVETAALSSVVPPLPVYRPLLDTGLLQRGVLSDVQLETIVYAGQAHGAFLMSDPMDPNGHPPRQGFLMGHGTGVGKGRAIAGILRDNWNQGRRRAVWVSERHRHIESARRDWVALGGRTHDIIDLSELKNGDDVAGGEGIVFLTYALLRGEQENATRVDQIVHWLGATSDHVVVFDECQNLRNAKVQKKRNQKTQPSKQGMASLKLQSALPNARVVYASATSASDIIGMGYAVRLGLWGHGTAFPTADNFITQMEEGGVNALELVARDLKAMGLYLAANLSFDGVTYERLEYRLTPEERAIQDSLAGAWAEVNVALQAALVSTGVTTLAKDAGNKVCAWARSQFGMSRSRFFQALLSSFKTRPVIAAVRADLAKGHSAVIQLTNTYEANADRALAAVDGDVNAVEATPRDILLEYIRNQFPVQKYRVVVAGKKFVARPLEDAQGNPVFCPKAEAQRDALVAKINALDLPEGPLEQIFAAFGAEAVAEVTGRNRRLVPGLLPGTRVLEERTPAMVNDDIRQFQCGLKRILAFSTAGASGSDYQADRDSGNKSLRRHYLLQAGWRADQAIQGLGRTHRSNQVQPPEYVLVMSDLWADRRMVSTVAAGMQGLGAITRGQRHAASQELFTEEDNLESNLAQEAWLAFLGHLEADRVANLSLTLFERETGIPLTDAVSGRLDPNVPAVRRFLNAMSGMTCEKQDIFGNAYKTCLDQARVAAVRAGLYDRGIEALNAESLVKLEDTVIYRDPRTGAATRLVKMLRVDSVDPIDYANAQRQAMRSGNARFVKSLLTNHVACLIYPRLLGNQVPMPDDKITVITPTGFRQTSRLDINRDRWTQAGALEIENLWAAEFAQPAHETETIFHVVTGTLLPLWDKLPKKKVTVYQMETDMGERILGRTLPDEWVARFTARMGALQGAAIDPVEALEGVERGNVATFANGWTAEGRVNLLTQKSRVEIVLNEEDSTPHQAGLERDGMTVDIEPLTGRPRFRLPEDPKKRRAAWKALTKRHPVASLSTLF